MEQHLAWELGVSVSIIFTLVATVYRNVNKRIDINKIDTKEKMEVLQVEVSNVILNYKDRFDSVGKRFDKVDKQFDNVDRQFDQVYESLEKAGNKQDDIINSLNTIANKLDKQVVTCQIISKNHNLFGKEDNENC